MAYPFYNVINNAFGNQKYGDWNYLAKQEYGDQFGQEGKTTTDYMGSKGGLFNMSKAVNPFSKGNMGPGGAGGAALNIGANVVGGIGQKLLSNGLNSGIGSGIGSVGSAVGSAVGAVNPVLGAAITVGSKVLGGAVTGAIGTSTNTKELAKAKAGINTLNNFRSNAGTFDNVTEGPTVEANSTVYKSGWARPDWAKKRNESLRQRKAAAQSFADRSIENNVRNISSSNMHKMLGNYAAFGGPLDGAIAYQFGNDFLHKYGPMNAQKSQSMPQMPNSFMADQMAFGGNMYDVGGYTDPPSKKERQRQEFNMAYWNSPLGRINRRIIRPRIYIPSDEKHFNASFPKDGQVPEDLGHLTGAGGGGRIGEAPVKRKKNKYSIVPTINFREETFNEAYARARANKQKEFEFNGKRYTTDYDPNVENWEEAGNSRKRVVADVGILPYQKAFGGDLGVHGADFSTGLVHVDNGGTHEENPNEGVPMGMDAQGTPNLVEEKETVWTDKQFADGGYVFSERLKVPEIDKKKKRKDYTFEDKILSKVQGLSFAEASKRFEKMLGADELNDNETKQTLTTYLAVLQQVQEQVRQEQEMQKLMAQLQQMSPEEIAQLQQQLAQGEEQQLAEAQEQQAAEEQARAEQQAAEQQGMPDEAAAQEAQAMQEQQMQEAAMQQQMAEQQAAQQAAEQQAAQQAMAEGQVSPELMAQAQAYGVSPELMAEQGMMAPEMGAFGGYIHANGGFLNKYAKGGWKEFYKAIGTTRNLWKKKTDAERAAMIRDYLVKNKMAFNDFLNQYTDIKNDLAGLVNKNPLFSTAVRPTVGQTTDNYYNSLPTDQRAYLDSYFGRGSLSEGVKRNADGSYDIPVSAMEEMAKYEQQPLSITPVQAYNFLTGATGDVADTNVFESRYGNPIAINDGKFTLQDILNNARGNLGDPIANMYNWDSKNNKWLNAAGEAVENAFDPNTSPFLDIQNSSDGKATIQSIALGNWLRTNGAGWFGSQDDAFLQAIKGLTDEQVKTLTTEQLADKMRNTDAYIKTSQWLEKQENALQYLTTLLNDPDTPEVAKKHARKFVNEIVGKPGQYEWKDGADKYNYKDVFGIVRNSHPGTYWHSAKEAYTPTGKRYELYEKNDKGELVGTGKYYKWPQEGVNGYTISENPVNIIGGVSTYSITRNPAVKHLYRRGDKWYDISDMPEEDRKKLHEYSADERKAKGFPVTGIKDDDTDYHFYGDLSDTDANGNNGKEKPPFPKPSMIPWYLATGLQGALLFSPTDYGNADALIARGNQASNYIPIRERSIFDYLADRPVDRNFEERKLRAQTNAGLRNFMDLSGGNRATAANYINNALYNYTNGLGDLDMKAELANRQHEKEVADFNTKTNQFNSQIALEAAKANQDAYTKAQTLGSELLAKGYAMREAIDDAKGKAIGNNLQNLANTIYNGYNQDYNNRLIGFGIQTGTWAPMNGREYASNDTEKQPIVINIPPYKQEKSIGAYGGSIKRRKKRGLSI